METKKLKLVNETSLTKKIKTLAAKGNITSLETKEELKPEQVKLKNNSFYQPKLLSQGRN